MHIAFEKYFYDTINSLKACTFLLSHSFFQYAIQIYIEIRGSQQEKRILVYTPATEAASLRGAHAKNSRVTYIG